MDFDRLTYWKKRMLAKLKTAFGWAEKDLKEIGDISSFVEFSNDDVKAALQKIIAGFSELQLSIVSAKLKINKGKETEKSKA